MQAFLSTAGSYLLTALASVFVFGSVIFIHELGHFMAAKYSGIAVHEFALGMGPALFRWKRKETTYALRLLPIGGFVSMEGEDEESDNEGSFTKAPVGNRILVIVAGALMNLLLGFVVLVIIVCMGSSITSRTVAEFYPGASTQASGLAQNDKILAVNGRRCFTAYDISYEFMRTQQGTADLTVLRDGQQMRLENVVFDTEKAEDGTTQLIIDFKVFGVKKTVANVLHEAFNWTLSLGRMVVLSLTDLVSGRIPVNNLSGPVGIVTAIGEASSAGLETLLMLLALITVNLGIFNILPLPALDGGKLVFLILEAIRRKPINQKYEIAINAAGFVLLIGIMLFATFNDITRLIR
ncbi:MAG: site-2 protease family protein [Ruthenibacterium sp.]